MTPDKHSREYLSAAIGKLKEQNPTALLTVADLDAIYHGEEEKIQMECSIEEDEARWAKKYD